MEPDMVPFREKYPMNPDVPKVIFFMKTAGWYRRLLRWITGCDAYHVGFLTKDSQWVYDMHFMRRRKEWPHVCTDHKDVPMELFQSPIDIPEEYWKSLLLDDQTVYGFADYAMFGLRKLFHLFGRSTRNYKGIICSEMVYIDLVANGWTVNYQEVPSPCKLRETLIRLEMPVIKGTGADFLKRQPQEEKNGGMDE